MYTNILTKEEILNWSKKYEKEQPSYDKRVEVEVGNRLRVTKELSKNDLRNIIKWKFGNIKGRLTRVSRYAEKNDGTILRRVSKLVFDLDKEYDKYKIGLLCIFDGIGVAVASVALTFYDPQNYGVFDIHVWRELFGEEPKNLFTTRNFQQVLTTLRKLSFEYDLPVRTIEKAYFRKNFGKKD